MHASYNQPSVKKGFLENYLDHLVQEFRNAERHVEFRYFAGLEHPNLDEQARMLGLAYILKAWQFTAFMPLRDAYDYVDDLLIFLFTPILTLMFSAGQMIRAVYELAYTAVELIKMLLGYSDFEKIGEHVGQFWDAVQFSIYSTVFFGVFTSIQCVFQSGLSLMSRPIITLLGATADDMQRLTPRFFREKDLIPDLGDLPSTPCCPKIML